MRQRTDGARALISRLTLPVQGLHSSEVLSHTTVDTVLLDVASNHASRRSGHMPLSIATIRAEHWRAIAPYAGAPASVGTRSESRLPLLSRQACNQASFAQNNTSTLTFLQSSKDRVLPVLRAAATLAAPSQGLNVQQSRGYAQAALQPQHRPVFQQARTAPVPASAPAPWAAAQPRMEPFIKGTIQKIQYENPKNTYKVLKARPSCPCNPLLKHSCQAHLRCPALVSTNYSQPLCKILACNCDQTLGMPTGEGFRAAWQAERRS